MQKLENGDIRLEINETGGTLQSVYDKKNQCEMLWQGDEKSWKSQDVIIFPIVGRLKDKTYTVEGKEYSMENHGLIRSAKLAVVFRTEDELTLNYCSDDETKTKYPYDFRFILNYKLTGNGFTVTFKVINTDIKPIYFGLGGHPAYFVDATESKDGTDTAGNKIIFSQSQKLINYYLNDDGTFISHKGDFCETDEIDFNKALMQKYKTLIFEGVDTKHVTLKRKNGRQIRFELHNPPILALWSHSVHGNYVCVEPWWGLPDFNEPIRELKDKEHIQCLKPGKEFQYSYTTKII